MRLLATTREDNPVELICIHCKTRNEWAA